jgi:hypothetical protein
MDEIAQAEGPGHHQSSSGATYDVLRVAEYIQEGLTGSRVDSMLLFREGEEEVTGRWDGARYAKTQLEELVKRKKGEAMDDGGRAGIAERRKKKGEGEEEASLRNLMDSLSKQAASVFERTLSTVATRARVRDPTDLGEIKGKDCVAREFKVCVCARRKRIIRVPAAIVVDEL